MSFALARKGALHDALHENEAAAKRYLEAFVAARSLKVASPTLDRAIRRLAVLADALGPDRMRARAAAVTDPDTKRPLVWTASMAARFRLGMTTVPDPSGLAPPLPVMP